MYKCKEISTVNMPHEEWLKHRQGHIGGSDASAIVGLNDYSSPYTVWADKLAMIPPKEDNEAMRLGRDLEQYVADRFTEATGKKVRRKNAILVNPNFPFAHANVDRLVVGEDAGLECKTTSVMNLKKFKNGEYPPTYYVQCMHYMMVTGAKRWYLAVLILGKEFKWFCIERDENEIEALKQAEEEFWQFVNTKTEPPMDGSKSTSDTISAIYPNGNGSEIDLMGVAKAVNLYVQYDKQVKEITKLRDEQKNTIQAYMGDSTKGNYADHTVTWNNQMRTTYDTKQLMADYPEIDFSKYAKTTNSRIFRFK